MGGGNFWWLVVWFGYIIDYYVLGGVVNDIDVIFFIGDDYRDVKDFVEWCMLVKY